MEQVDKETQAGRVRRAVQEALVPALHEDRRVLIAAEDQRRYLRARRPGVQKLIEGGQARGIGSAAQGVLIERGDEAVVGSAALGLEELLRADQGGRHLLVGPAGADESRKGRNAVRIGRAVQVLLVKGVYL